MELPEAQVSHLQNGHEVLPMGVVGITSNDQAMCLYSTPGMCVGRAAHVSVSSAQHSADPDELLGTVCHVSYWFALIGCQQPLGLYESVGLSLVFQVKYGVAEAQGLLEAGVSSPLAHSRSCGPRKGHLGQLVRPSCHLRLQVSTRASEV